LQFITPEERQSLLDSIYRGLLPGGILILSEKLCFANDREQALMTDLHLAFKRANGYSAMEISQKRAALENVLIPETLAVHSERLTQAGFSQSSQWFQCFNFASILAIK
jgi:tRNA (cmo5U34)-methyltransferase